MTNGEKGAILLVNYCYENRMYVKIIDCEVINMKELYVSPEAEVICFAAEENLAWNETGITSFLGWEVDDTKDGDWNNWDKSFQLANL